MESDFSECVVVRQFKGRGLVMPHVEGVAVGAGGAVHRAEGVQGGRGRGRGGTGWRGRAGEGGWLGQGAGPALPWTGRRT